MLSGVGLSLGAAAMTRDISGSRAAQLADLGLKFDGAGSCASCHGEGDTTVPPADAEAANDNANSIWFEKDPHSTAFLTLEEQASKDIMAKLGGGNATESSQCLSCHALDVPATLHGKDFVLAEGNTCTSCHGPSEKWLDPHDVAGWADGLREKMTPDEMLAEWGLYDTSPAVQRAEICVSCHLRIEPQLVAAGHPQTTFELAYDSEWSDKKNAGWKHWIDDGDYEVTKLWLAGQVSGLHQALLQLHDRAAAGAEADSIATAYHIAEAYWRTAAPALKQAKVDLHGLDTAMTAVQDNATDAAKVADAATKAAEAAEQVDVSEVTPDQALTTAALKGVIANTDLAADLGPEGFANQAKSIYALFDALNRAGVVSGVPQVVVDLDAMRYGDLDAAAVRKQLGEVEKAIP